jgi:hypothetical protein
MGPTTTWRGNRKGLDTSTIQLPAMGQLLVGELAKSLRSSSSARLALLVLHGWTKKHPDIPILEHLCYKNHSSSSGSMEAAGIVELVEELFNKFQVVTEILCCDDDSLLHADCSWSNEDYLKNNNTDQLPMVEKKVGKKKGMLCSTVSE